MILLLEMNIFFKLIRISFTYFFEIRNLVKSKLLSLWIHINFCIIIRLRILQDSNPDILKRTKRWSVSGSQNPKYYNSHLNPTLVKSEVIKFQNDNFLNKNML